MDVENTSFFEPGATAYVEDPARPVLAYGRDLAAGAANAPHSHPRGQLLWAMTGVLRVVSGNSVWMVPPSHAVWIPGGTRHNIVTETAARTRNLYVDPSRPVRAGTAECTVLLLTPLMREIVLRLSEQAGDAAGDARLGRLGEVALDEIERLEEAPLSLPGGHDPRLQRLIADLERDPGDRRSLPELAALAGASPRTLERLFSRETGLTFRQWRSRLRLLKAVEMLHRGESSTAIAYSLGYRGPSAFVAAFRQHFGCPPQSFLERHDGNAHPRGPETGAGSSPRETAGKELD